MANFAVAGADTAAQVDVWDAFEFGCCKDFLACKIRRFARTAGLAIGREAAACEVAMLGTLDCRAGFAIIDAC